MTSTTYLPHFFAFLKMFIPNLSEKLQIRIVRLWGVGTICLALLLFLILVRPGPAYWQQKFKSHSNNSQAEGFEEGEGFEAFALDVTERFKAAFPA